MKLIYQGATPVHERLTWVQVVMINTVQNMLAIMCASRSVRKASRADARRVLHSGALPELDLELDGDLAIDASWLQHADSYEDRDYFCRYLATPITNLYASEPVKAAIARRNEFQLVRLLDFIALASY